MTAKEQAEEIVKDSTREVPAGDLGCSDSVISFSIVGEIAAALEAKDKEIERLNQELKDCMNALSLTARGEVEMRSQLAEAKEALKAMVKSTEDWNEAVYRIIGRDAKSGIDLEAARAVLQKLEWKV